MPFKDKNREREYRREYQRKYREANREKVRTWKRKYDESHKDEVQKNNLEYKRRLNEVWRNGISLGQGHGSLEKAKYIENFAETYALPKLGFTDIFRAYSTFPFDFICEYNGKKVLVDVTGARARPLRRKRLYAEKLGLPLYLLIIKPDLSVFLLQEVKQDHLWLSTQVVLEETCSRRDNLNV